MISECGQRDVARVRRRDDGVTFVGRLMIYRPIHIRRSGALPQWGLGRAVAPHVPDCLAELAADWEYNFRQLSLANGTHSS